MAHEPPLYDLILLLDTQVDDERRSEIVDNVEQAIEGGGELVGRHDWGVRATAFEVRKRADADYRLLQFRAEPELLERLEHTLKITDGVIRFRIIKLRPGTPDPPDLRPSATPTTAPPEPAPAEIS